MQRADNNCSPRRSGTTRWLLLPCLLVASLCLVPVVYLVLRATGLGPRFWTLLFSLRTGEVLLNSLTLAAAVTLSSTLIGVTLAWLTVCSNLPGRRLWTTVACIPLAVPSYVGAFAFISAFGPRGGLQHLLSGLGVENLPSVYGFPGAWLVLTLCTYPYVMLSVRAALCGMDPSLTDAAYSLGRSGPRVFLDVTLPQIRPSIQAGALLSCLYAISDFGAVSLLQYKSFTQAIYLQYIASFDRQVASVLALLLVVLAAVIVTAEAGTHGRARYYRSSAGSLRLTQPVRLGWWTVPALLLCAVVIVLGVGVPLGMIVYWFSLGAGQHAPLAKDGIAAWHSLYASGFGALFTVLAALPLVVLVVRQPGPLSRGLQRVTYVGHALPGVVLALALVYFASQASPHFLYQSLALLVIAYVIHFLPLAVSNLQGPMLQQSPRLEEAARNLGRSSWQVFRTITLPLLRPGIIMALAMVFLSCMKELPATLLLGPTEFPTLATRIWATTEEAFFRRAALPSLLLICVSAAFVWILLRQEEATP